MSTTLPRFVISIDMVPTPLPCYCCGMKKCLVHVFLLLEGGTMWGGIDIRASHVDARYLNINLGPINLLMYLYWPFIFCKCLSPA